ncbi:hypothetical protein, partial [Escherichia coli]|uniref:hypothetical protein n=1 Tax=Escherichia coli TaxID=562 RepID=UPI001954DBF6
SAPSSIALAMGSGMRNIALYELYYPLACMCLFLLRVNQRTFGGPGLLAVPLMCVLSAAYLE